MGTAVILVIHVFLAAGIIGLVLLQRGKGADAGAGFGSGASGTVFGARGSSTVLSKTTAILATLFFVTSLTLAYLGGRTGPAAPDSLLERASKAQPAKSGTGADPATKSGETPPAPVPEQPLGSAPPAPEAPKDTAAPGDGASGKKP